MIFATLFLSEPIALLTFREWHQRSIVVEAEQLVITCWSEGK